jgi:ATP-binding cassette subfamily B protein
MTGAPDLDHLAPVKRRFESRRRVVPFVQQMESADCGAACLAMVLGHLGRATRLDEVRPVLDPGRDGLDALALVRAAEQLGLRARGVTIDVRELSHLPQGSILHWELNHFVVYDRAFRDGVQIVDPAVGRRRVSMERFKRSFTGVALLFEAKDELAPRAADNRALRRVFRRLGERRGLIARSLVLSIGLRLLGLSAPLLTGLIVDRVVPRADLELLGLIGVGLGVVVVFVSLSTLLRAHLLLRLRTELDTNMTLGFVEHLMELPYSYFQRRSTGDLMLRVGANAVIREVLTSATLSSLLDGTLTAVYLFLCAWLSPGMAALALAFAAVQLGVFVFARRRLRELMTEDLEAQARSQSYLGQMLSGIETLKATGSEQRALSQWSNLFARQLNVSLDRGRINALTDSVGAGLSMAAPLGLVAFGASQVLDGSLALGTMLAVVSMATGFLQPLRTLIENALALQTLGSHVERIDDVLSATPEQDRSERRPTPRLSGQIDLSRLSFRYAAAAPPVLEDIALSIRPGESVAIVGRSGSGKSTLARLIVGLLAPSTGRVSYDGHDLSTLDLRAVRQRVGVVPQVPYIFAGTVRDNIALGANDAPPERIIAAAHRARLHEDILAMPMGYDTLISDAGATLSGGQRQRLALARALLNDPVVLLLDEATSSLDAVTERAVIQSIAELRCTRIVIAHRLSTVVNADRILVLEQGRVVEDGSHRELLARGGAYSRLVQAQLRQPELPA